MALVFYTYLGYGIVLFVMVRLKRLFSKTQKQTQKNELPEVTVLIPAYNEKDFIQQKIENTRQLDYPAEKIRQIWVTDGSDDGTQNLIKKYSDVEVLHRDERLGKIAAINRGMKYVKTEIVIFSDANTILGKQSVKKIVELFENKKVGCVSGEKRISNTSKEAAASAGEGLYWKYESQLKRWDAELNSVVGAAGELFAIRTELFQDVEHDTILDDFIISLRIAMMGYKIGYHPDAYASEIASANVKEELKRKIRIAAGGIQSVIRLSGLLNVFRYGLLSFQYISHRVLRWTLAPISLVFILILNILLLGKADLYTYLFWMQAIFYAFALMGKKGEHIKLKPKALFAPYYFSVMNYAVFAGFFRYLKKSQSVNWERAKRGSLV